MTSSMSEGNNVQVSLYIFQNKYYVRYFWIIRKIIHKALLTLKTFYVSHIDIKREPKKSLIKSGYYLKDGSSDKNQINW